MTPLKRAVRRTVRREVGVRPLVVTLYPGIARNFDPNGSPVAEIEVREARRRTGYRVSIATLYTMLARRAAGLPAPQGRRARRVS